MSLKYAWNRATRGSWYFDRIKVADDLDVGDDLTVGGDLIVGGQVAGVPAWETRVFWYSLAGSYMYLANGAVTTNFAAAPGPNLDKDAGAWHLSGAITVPAAYQSGYYCRVSGDLSMGPNPWTNWSAQTSLVTWLANPWGFTYVPGAYLAGNPVINFTYPGLFPTALHFSWVYDPAVHGNTHNQVVTWYDPAAFGGTPYLINNLAFEVMPK